MFQMQDIDDRLRFGPFELNLVTLELRREGTYVHLAPQPAKLLALLATRRGEMVSHEEIREHVWGKLSVEADAGLHTCIRQIRHALKDEAGSPKYVETISRRGYRFIGVQVPEERERVVFARHRDLLRKQAEALVAEQAAS